MNCTNLKATLLLVAVSVFAFALPDMVFGQALAEDDGRLWDALNAASVQAEDFVGNFSPGTHLFMQSWYAATAALKTSSVSLQAVESDCNTMQQQARAYGLEMEQLLGRGWRERFCRGHKRAATVPSLPATDSEGRLRPNGVLFSAYRQGFRH